MLSNKSIIWNLIDPMNLLLDQSDVTFQFGPGMTLYGNTDEGKPALIHWDFNAVSVCNVFAIFTV